MNLVFNNEIQIYFRILILLQEKYLETLESHFIRLSYFHQINFSKRTLNWFATCNAVNQCINQFRF